MAQEALARVGRGPPELPPVWGLPPPPCPSLEPIVLDCSSFQVSEFGSFGLVFLFRVGQFTCGHNRLPSLFQDEDFALPKCEAVRFFQQVLKCRCISDSSFE